MSNKKLTQLTALSAITTDDIFVLTDAPGGTALSRKCTWQIILDYFTNNAIGAMTHNGNVTVQDTTAAAAGSQVNSPYVKWLGAGWKTDATARSLPITVRSRIEPIQWTSEPSFRWLATGQVGTPATNPGGASNGNELNLLYLDWNGTAFNTGFGYAVFPMGALFTGVDNTAFGFSCGNDLTTGSDNTMVGYQAGQNLITGGQNTLIGSRSGYNTEIGNYNVAVGYNTLAGNETGGSQNDGNIAIGYYSLNLATDARFNCAIGYNVLPILTTGRYNTGFGVSALSSVTTVNSCLGVGAYAGGYETAANKVFIDTLDRGSEANGRLYSLVYGVVAAAGSIANQFVSLGGGGNVGIGIQTFGTSATQTLCVGTGVAPSTSPTNAFQMYSADESAGNACPTFRTENGTIIQLCATPVFTGIALTANQASGAGVSTTSTLTMPGRDVNGDENNNLRTLVIQPGSDTYEIANTKTDSGSRQGLSINSYVNDAGFLGTLADQYGVIIETGIYAGAGTVTNARGVGIQFDSSAGVITNAYGFVLSESAGAGTITNRWGVYIATAGWNSYFNGSIGIGVNTFGTSAAGVLTMKNGTPPSAAYPADSSCVYANDISDAASADNGKSAIHVKTEAASIIKLYQAAAVADATDAPSVILRLNELLARMRLIGLIAP